MNFIFKKLSRNKKTKKTKKTKNRRKKLIGLTRKKPKQYKQYKQYKKIFKGGYPPQYVEVLKKYYYIFGNYIFDKILNSEIFKTPNHISTLIKYLNDKTTNKNLNNEEQITVILRPALEDFINKVVKNNKPYPTSSENVLVITAFSLPTEIILKKMLSPAIIEKILKKSEKNKLIENFKSDLEILKMKPTDKEAAITAAKEAVAAHAAVTSVENEPTPDKSNKSNKSNKHNKGSNKTPTNSDEHFGIMGAKPKSRRLSVRRKKRETKRYHRRN